MGQEQKKTLSFIFLFLKGLIMGICDLIPGVSGGTVALMTGIYERLLNAINQIRWKNVRLLLKGQFFSFWVIIDGNFLIILLSGIVSSLLIFPKFIRSLQVNYPTPLYAFFLGLVLSSALHFLQRIRIKTSINMLMLLFGFFFVAIILHIPIITFNTSYIYLFLCGFIVISAMILPGISGSLVLLILGGYNIIINALTEFHLNILSIFASGCIVGILSTSHFLSILLKKFYEQTLAFFTGVLFGSTIKLWPWKLIKDVAQISHRDGSITFTPILEQNVWFNQYSIITHSETLMNINKKEPYVLLCIICFFLGFVLFLTIEKITKDNKQKH